jgi:hypothetical protein
MAVDLSSLTGMSFNELNASILLTTGAGGGISVSGGVYTVQPNSAGNLAIYDTWAGLIGSPSPSDVLSLNIAHTYGPLATAPYGVIGYTLTDATGTTVPPTGALGAEVIAWNSTQILVEQSNGFVPGSGIFIPNGKFFVIGLTDISTFDGSVTTGQTFTFSTTGAFPNIPEPSTAVIMPLLIAALLVSRMPSVREFLRGF